MHATTRSELISFRLTPDQRERLQRKLKLNTALAPKIGDLAHKLVLEWLDGPTEESTSHKLDRMLSAVEKLRYDLLTTTRYIVAAHDGENTSEQRDKEIETCLKQALRLA